MARPARQSAKRQHRRTCGEPQFTGWCLDKEDLCVAKLCALREKDQNFVGALLDPGLADAAVIAARLPMVAERSSRAPSEQSSGWPRVERRDRRPVTVNVTVTGADL